MDRITRKLLREAITATCAHCGMDCTGVYMCTSCGSEDIIPVYDIPSDDATSDYLGLESVREDGQSDFLAKQKKKEKKPKGCARCGSTQLYAGGLCQQCAQSFGTWKENKRKLREGASFLNDLDVNNTGVEVVGGGVERFPNLAAARLRYPTLDPYNNGPEFTWAMRGEDQKTGATLLRFETWAMYRALSQD